MLVILSCAKNFMWSSVVAELFNRYFVFAQIAFRFFDMTIYYIYQDSTKYTL